ncbi:hypothetical protein Ccrd_003943 [Cynara cardunculus var. scolymus]|uniref:Peptidase S9 prolyl oligopeptidase catalytic domain-containing protein n=1 Tax=Cynara cardunculus var. scolymus TaxID=59895 RepID=A0A124SCJ7_CYNCS|nr:hypothetical protein Ccrd_003943 [Cynara cardunculus var. scolymus]
MVSYMSLLMYGVGGIVVAGMALLVVFQEKLVYVPVLPGLTKSYPITPARLRLIYEDVWLTSSDGLRLHSWFIKFSPDCTASLHCYLKQRSEEWKKNKSKEATLDLEECPKSSKSYLNSYSIEGEILKLPLLISVFFSLPECSTIVNLALGTIVQKSLKNGMEKANGVVDKNKAGGERERWSLPSQGPAKRDKLKSPTILFFQENAGNIAHRLEMVRIMLQKLHCNIFMLSYRGYGASDGYPSQQGIIRDAQAALDHLSQRTDIDTSQIVVFGRSLGGAVGAVVTKNNPDKVAALVLENTFTSILDMAGVLLPFLKWFIGGSISKGPKILNFVVRSPWNTIDVISQVKLLVEQPILFLSGQRDEMVPPFHMQMLYAKAAAHNKRCIFVDFPTGMHMDTWLAGGDHYWKTVQTFIQQNVREKKDDESRLNTSGIFRRSVTNFFKNGR